MDDVTTTSRAVVDALRALTNARSTLEAQEQMMAGARAREADALAALEAARTAHDAALEAASRA